MSGIEKQIVRLLLLEPYLVVNKSFLVQLTTEARFEIFEGYHGKDYYYSLDLKELAADQIDKMKDWLTEQSFNYILTDWLMIGFKSESDAALCKLFWL